MTPSTPAEAIERFEKAVRYVEMLSMSNCTRETFDKAWADLDAKRAALLDLLSQGETRAVEDYWFRFYADGHCTLCANHGVIDSTGLRTPAGYEVGRKNYCICPNGQVLRKSDAPIVGAGAQELRHQRPDFYADDSNPNARTAEASAGPTAGTCESCQHAAPINTFTIFAEGPKFRWCGVIGHTVPLTVNGQPFSCAAYTPTGAPGPEETR